MPQYTVTLRNTDTSKVIERVITAKNNEQAISKALELAEHMTEDQDSEWLVSRVDPITTTL